MFIKIKSNEIAIVSKILSNNFYNVKNKNNLEMFIYKYIANYYILSIKNDFTCNLIYNPDEKDCCNFINLLVDDYNYFFNENIKIKQENINIVIDKGGFNE